MPSLPPIGHLPRRSPARAIAAATLMLLGGAPMDGDRHIWWNFVASDQTLIEAAKQRWRDGRFPEVPGETEFIALPER